MDIFLFCVWCVVSSLPGVVGSDLVGGMDIFCFVCGVLSVRFLVLWVRISLEARIFFVLCVVSCQFASWSCGFGSRWRDGYLSVLCVACCQFASWCCGFRSRWRHGYLLFCVWCVVSSLPGVVGSDPVGGMDIFCFVCGVLSVRFLELWVRIPLEGWISFCIVCGVLSVRFLVLWVQIPLEAWISFVLCVVCCQFASWSCGFGSRWRD